MSFKDYIKEERQSFPTSLSTVHDGFLSLGLDQKDSEYFYKNASEIVEQLRARNWVEFQQREEDFSVRLLSSLIEENIEEYKSSKDAVESYIRDNVDNFYSLALSNTQSRRSRAGGEFEAILSHLLMGAEIFFEEQGLIGEGLFDSKQLAKLVDHVIPGSIEYNLSKRSTYAISAKTTLRERWQQIGDEMARTGMPEIYLATLDEKIGTNTLTQLRANNIYPVTTKQIKEKCYNDDNLVITFEDLLQELKMKSDFWTSDRYDEDEKAERIKRLNIAIENNADRPYIQNYYKKWLSKFE